MTTQAAKSEFDPDLYEFARLTLDAIRLTPRLVELVTRPIDQPEQHPMVRIAQQAIQRGEVQQVRSTLEQWLKDELADMRDHRAVERQIANILAIFDAAVKRDPVGLREAVRLAVKPKRSEWEEAV